MQSLEAACDEGERPVKKAKLSRSSLPLIRPQEPSCSTSQDYIAVTTVKAPFDIFAKLKELHEQEIAKSSENSCETSLLLEKLVARERLNTLIFNLYPGNKGYSLAFRTASCPDPTSDFAEDTAADMIETNPRPYEEGNLLRYIDNEELPPYIVDLLEPEFSYLFYSGCVIAEIRDYRQAYPHTKCDTHHVLLRPTLKSFLSDINNLADDKPEWSVDERDQLESQMLMANEPALCLDPDSSVSSKVVEINNQKQIFNTQKFRRMAKKFSQVTVNRKRKLDRFTYRHGMELFEFLNRTRSKPKIGTLTQKGATLSKRLSTSTSTSLEDTAKPVAVPAPSLEPSIQLVPPSQPVVIQSFKTYPRPKESSDWVPQLIEEYVLETDMPSKDKGRPRVYHIKLSILQRPSNSEYLGELYLDRDHKKNEQNGVACRFSLGSKANANRYIHQFAEIFTESGRKSVRIRYGSSSSYKVTQTQAQQIQAQSSAVQGQPNLAQQHITQLTQSLQAQTMVNGSIGGNVGGSIGVNVGASGSIGGNIGTNVAGNIGANVAGTIGVQSTSSVPILQSHLQGISQQKASQSQALSNQEQAINALANNLMNSVQQYQAAVNAKQQQQQQQQQQKLQSNNAAIINLLNSPASVANSDASAAVVNAINSGVVAGSTSGQQYLSTAVGQKLLATGLGRKMTAATATSQTAVQANARVLNHGGLIALNSNRLQQQQAQTITLTSMGTSGNYTNFTVPVKQQRIVNSSSDSNKSALSALLVGTPAADRPDIIGPNTNSLLLEKLGAATSTPPQYGQTTSGKSAAATAQQFLVQSSPKGAVASPMSSPPLAQQHQPQAQATVQSAPQTVNVQGLNFAQLQSIPVF
ncbi:unnamed protein product [Acanthoscelides obtectus]|uniref:Spt20-like SEP domain-containing protein n=1 Tax=Acanthoscelides obtectus TaxID=200917 RepID=A0A9P0JH54_ACAOB|nr:unnamed protein product [Acanthoscelides obtectus]CAK1649920.1 Transcription factor SPT20 homolog [Acanthoscelides obtectus]